MDPLVSIVIPVKNEAQSIPIILGQNFQYPYEIIIIDSGSTDDSVEFIHEISHKAESVSLMKIPPKAVNGQAKRDHLWPSKRDPLG